MNVIAYQPSALAATVTSLGPEKPLPDRVAAALSGTSLPAFSSGSSCSTCKVMERKKHSNP